MLPPAIERVRYFNRNERIDYVKWMCRQTGVEFDKEMLLFRSRPDIDELFMEPAPDDEYQTALDEYVSEDPVEVETEEFVDERWEEAMESFNSEPPVEEPTMAMGDYASYTVRELQEECRRREITIRGTKSEVVMRLRRHDEGLLDAPDEDEAEAPAEEAAAEDESDAPAEEAAATIGDEDAPDSGQEQIDDTDE